MENLYLIAGLGNPGAEYAQTRHNAGFLAVDELAQRLRASWKLEAKFEARIARSEFDGRKALLCEPLTYMNSSGTALSAVMHYFKIEPPRLLVIVDDADLPFGEIRLRANGSSGGHHGLESIESHLGTREYARLRVGIGRQAAGVREIEGYVLGRFRPEEMNLLGSVIKRVADQAACWVTEGIQKAMNRFNGVVNTQ